MRDVLVISIIMLFVFGGDICIEKYLEKSSTDLLGYFEEMSGDFDADYAKKVNRVNEVLALWEKYETPWIIFEYHDSINEIEDLLIEVYTYYLNNNKPEFNVSYGKLRRSVDDLKNRIELSCENVL